jgi:hypothetical protein
MSKILVFENDCQTNIPEEKTSEILEDLLLEIVNKKLWYSKVFDSKIVEKWKKEFFHQTTNEYNQKHVEKIYSRAKTSPINFNCLFDMVINFAKATAQGKVEIQSECDYDNEDQLCDTCKGEVMILLSNDPIKLGIDKKDAGHYIQDAQQDNFDDFIDIYNCRHARCKCTAPDFELHKYVEYIPEGVLSEIMHVSLYNEIIQMMKNEPIDWHPGSNSQVRDLIHPSLYCYVRGVSLVDQEGEEFLENCGPEEERYQWLPTEFHVNKKGFVERKSYINNFDEKKYPKLDNLISLCFQSFLPSLEKVLKINFNNKNLQVIVKIGSIHLNKENNTYEGGSWHIEGMPYEYIAATCIHYVNVENITDSYLEFRKPVIFSEESDYPQNGTVYTTHHFGITPDTHYDGKMNRYLGLIKAQTGASIIFPNSLQHRVKEFSLNVLEKVPLSLKGETGERIILAFFVIDPKKRILSTKDVMPQQDIFTKKQAELFRERLMYHRKYFYSILNEQIFERPFSLCEH